MGILLTLLAPLSLMEVILTLLSPLSTVGGITDAIISNDNSVRMAIVNNGSNTNAFTVISNNGNATNAIIDNGNI